MKLPSTTSDVLLRSLALTRCWCEAMRMIGALAKKLSACAFGALLMAMLVPGAMAHADQTAVEFNNYLVAHGLNLGGPDQAAKVAHLMCQDLDAGFTHADAVQELTKHDLSEAQAELFVSGATVYYCPWHKPKSPGGS